MFYKCYSITLSFFYLSIFGKKIDELNLNGSTENRLTVIYLKYSNPHCSFLFKPFSFILQHRNWGRRRNRIVKLRFRCLYQFVRRWHFVHLLCALVRWVLMLLTMKTVELLATQTLLALRPKHDQFGNRAISANSSEMRYFCPLKAIKSKTNYKILKFNLSID